MYYTTNQNLIPNDVKKAREYLLHEDKNYSPKRVFDKDPIGTTGIFIREYAHIEDAVKDWLRSSIRNVLLKGTVAGEIVFIDARWDST